MKGFPMSSTRRFTRLVVLGLTVLCGSVYFPPGGSAHAAWNTLPACPQPGAIPLYLDMDPNTYPAGTKLCNPADLFTHYLAFKPWC